MPSEDRQARLPGVGRAYFCRRQIPCHFFGFAEDLLGDVRFRKKKQERYASASSLLVLNLTLSAVLSKFVLTLLMISETQY